MHDKIFPETLPDTDARDGVNYAAMAGCEMESTDIAACLSQAATQACGEALRASIKWGAFHSAHEGLAILLEEFDELKAHVWTNQKRRDLAAMRDEAIQVAAMALRFVVDISDGGRGRI